MPRSNRIPIARDHASDAGFWTKKRLGQHLLRDSTVVRDSLQALGTVPGDTILEIGPGLGAMTEALLSLDAQVLGVELDPKACEVLQSRFGSFPNFRLIQGDILKVDLRSLTANVAPGKLQIAANLPYYITTPVLAKLLEEEIPFKRMVALTQWEVAERLAASPGRKTYAAISVLIQFWCEIKVLRRVLPGAFTPPPKVDSGLILFQKLEKPSVDVVDRSLFFSVVRSCFGKRRKTLKNSLKMSRDPELKERDFDTAFKAAGIDPARRPETLSLLEFSKLSNAIDQFRQGVPNGGIE